MLNSKRPIAGAPSQILRYIRVNTYHARHIKVVSGSYRLQNEIVYTSMAVGSAVNTPLAANVPLGGGLVRVSGARTTCLCAGAIIDSAVETPLAINLPLDGGLVRMTRTHATSLEVGVVVETSLA